MERLAGDGEANAVLDDAQAASKALLGPKAVAWAQATASHTDPELILELAQTWRLPHAASPERGRARMA